MAGASYFWVSRPGSSAPYIRAEVAAQAIRQLNLLHDDVADRHRVAFLDMPFVTRKEVEEIQIRQPAKS